MESSEGDVDSDLMDYLLASSDGESRSSSDSSAGASSDSSDSSNPPPDAYKLRNKRTSTAERRAAVANSRFNKYLLSASEDEMTETGICDPTTYEGKRFRWRFRVPYSLFLEPVEEYKEHVTKVAGRPWKGFYDLRLLILGALRVLGSSVAFDLIQELNEISEETNRVFFHKFIAWGRG